MWQILKILFKITLTGIIKFVIIVGANILEADMYKIGIDLGGTNIALGIIKDDEIVFKKSIPTGLPKEPSELVNDIKNLVNNCVEKFGITMEDIEKVGFGIPGSINEKNSYLEFANNFGYVHVPLIKMLKESLKLPVFAGNDANVAALAEYTLGAARGAKSMAMANIINIFQPEVFVIGGGVSHAGDALLQPLKTMVGEQVYSRTMDINTKIVPAALGNDAGILGAGKLGEY